MATKKAIQKILELLKKERLEYDRYEKLCEDPEGQHNWDAMQISAGTVVGLEIALNILRGEE